MTKKLLALLLSVLMLVGLFAGCAQTQTDNTTGTTADTTASSDTTSGDDTDELEPVTLRIFVQNPSGTDDDLVEEYINSLPSVQALNVTVDIVTFSTANERSEKIPLMLCTSEQMDIIWDASSTFATYMSQGIYADVSEYVKADPEFYNIFAEQLWDGVSYNGGIYGFPCSKGVTEEWVFYACSAILDEYNIDPDSITDFQDVEVVLEALKQDGNSELMAVSTWSSLMTLALTDDYNPVQSSWAYGAIARRDETRKVVNIFETEEFRELVETMYDWNQKGYIYQDVLTNGTGSRYSKGGYKYGLTCLSWSPTKEYGLHDKNCDDEDSEIVVLHVADGPRITNSSCRGSVMCITERCENKERAVEFMKLCYTDPDLVNAFCYGVPDVHYTLDENGRVVTVENIWDLWKGQYWLVGNPQLLTLKPAEVENKYDLLAERNKIGENAMDLGFVMNTKTTGTWLANINAVLAEYAPPLLNGFVDPETGITNLNEQLKAAGMDEMIAEIQSQIDAWAALN